MRLDAEIVEARIQLEGAVAAGTILHARMTDIGTGGRNAVARDGNGHEYLLPVVFGGVTQGAQISVEVTREAIPGTEPWKRPLARITDETPRPATELEEKFCLSVSRRPPGAGGVVRPAGGRPKRHRALPGR